MSNQEKLQYARSRLGLARMMGDDSEVEKWKEHVAYWEAAEQGVQADGAYWCCQKCNSFCSVKFANCGLCGTPRR